METCRGDEAPGRLGIIARQVAPELGGVADVILFWELYWFIREQAAQVGCLDCLKAVFADDLHWGNNEARRWSQMFAYMTVDLIFTTYGYVFHDFYPEVRGFGRCFWVPHSASPDFLVPFNAGAENALLLSRAISHHYPLRERLMTLCQEGALPHRAPPAPRLWNGL